jgi:RND family efflux transporter MFP subunit
MIPLVFALAACSRGTTESAEAAIAPAEVAVATAEVEAAAWRPTAEITGSAEPVRRVELGFDVPGRLDRVLVHRGDTVAEGQSLAVLDSDVAQGQLAQARAGVAAAEAGAAAAEDAWTRLQQLGEAVSPQQRAQAEAQVKGARAQLEQARAGERMAATNASLHTLRAPFSGVLTSAPDNPGALVGAGMPLFVVEDLSALRVKGTAAESDGWLAVGLPATVRAGTGADTAPAVVERVIPSLDPATRRVPVEIRIDTPPAWLRAHAFVRVAVESGEPVDALAIPKGALVARPDFAVLVVSGPDAAPVRVPVAVLGERDGKVVVSGDLAVGAKVAVDPPQGWGE